MVTLIKGGLQVKRFLKQDPEANIWTQEGCEWVEQKAPFT